MSNKLISIVIPAYNESENIPKTVPTILNLIKPLPYRFEIIMVADGCTDNTMDKIQELVLEHKNIFYIEFSRNFGHQNALKAGLDHASGDCVISLDCDLQHPPEIIPEMLSKYLQEMPLEVLPFRMRESLRGFRV